MAILSVSGLSTGLDSGKLVEQLVALERRPLDLQIGTRDATTATRDAFATLNTKLLALLSAVDALRAPADVLAKKAVSSDATVLDVTAGTGAADGATTVTVSQLATASRATATTGTSALTSAVATGTGTFEFTVGGGSTQTVNLTASTTLQNLIDGINALGAGVTASAVNVGTPSAPSYKLQVVANATGTTSDIAVTGDGTTLGIAASAATNASFTVTGFPDTIQRASNTVGDVIAGATVTLKKAGSAQVTVSNDTSAIQAKVQGVVDAYNDVVRFVAENSAITRDGDEESTLGALANSPTVRSVLARLQQDLRTSISGVTGGVTTLSQIGIATQQDGTVTFNAGTFQSQLAATPQGLGELFGGPGVASGVADLLHGTLADLTSATGLIATQQTRLGDEIRRINDGIASGERLLETFRQDLEAQFAALEEAVGLIQSQGTFLLSQLASLTSVFAQRTGAR